MRATATIASVGSLILTCAIFAPASSCSGPTSPGVDEGPSSASALAARRAATIMRQQAAAGAAYRLTVDEAGAHAAHNPAQQLDLRFEAGGVRVTPTGRSAWSLELRFAGIARAEAMPEAAPPQDLPRVQIASKQLRHKRGRGLVEWYVNGPLGLQQGFDLAQRPEGQRGPVWILTEIGGALTPRAEPARAQVLLEDEAGRARLRMDRLYVFDATGRALPAELQASGRRIAIRVDDRGAVYPLRVDPLIGAYQDSIYADDPSVSASFGYSIAVSGDTAIIGAPRADDAVAGVDVGAAYVFTLTGEVWTQQTKLLAEDPTADSWFGVDVGLTGNVAVVGAYKDDEFGTDSGAVYVFTRSGDVWTQQAKLSSSNPGTNRYFGSRLDLSEDGSTFIARQSGGPVIMSGAGATWDEEAILTDPLDHVLSGFGSAVAVDGDTAAVSAPYTSCGTGCLFPGRVNMYERSAGVWSPGQTIEGSGIVGAQFGRGIELEGDTLVVAVFGRDRSHVYRRLTDWTRVMTLYSSDMGGLSSVYNGYIVSIAGDHVLTSGFTSEVNQPSRQYGLLYNIGTTDTTVHQQAVLRGPSGGYILRDEWNPSVALTVDAAFIGAPKAVSGGAVHVYELVPCGDGVVDNGEECDDGNEVGGDGCAAYCAVEAGFDCVGTAPTVCTDFDECSGENGGHDCDENATCDNTPGSFTCTCNTNYVGDGRSCDLDECAAGLDNCDPNARCLNTDGSFFCSCNGGYTGDGTICTDIDECADETDSCDENATCANTDGSYTCTCNTGWEGNGRSCTDIDECRTNTDDCDPNAYCTNIVGGYGCTCVFGYEGDGFTCTDIDECTAGTDNCDANATCTNTAGGFDCACNEHYGGNGQTCDLDECAAGVDDCDVNARCRNMIGGFVCDCLTGYSGDGRTCTDDDECALGSDTCFPGATCTNTDGSYTCSCPDGFEGDGHICLDVDECDLGTHSCHANATCQNTLGSHTCTCDLGYEGDGFTCTPSAATDAGATGDTGTTTGEAGTTTGDAGTSTGDAGTSTGDAGTSAGDAGGASTDAGAASSDTGSTSTADAGPPTAEGDVEDDGDAAGGDGCGCAAKRDRASSLIALMMVPALVWRRRSTST